MIAKQHKHDDTKMHRKNTHILTAKHRLAEWLIKGTARDT